MYAVIESGGKQHRVEEGEILRLEKLDAAAGDKLKFDKILLVGEGESVKIGKPYVKGGCKKAVQNDKLKDYEIEKPLPMLDLSKWDDCKEEE